MDTKKYISAEVAERLGVATRKVKYYCGLGFVPGIKRVASSQHELTERQMIFRSLL